MKLTKITGVLTALALIAGTVVVAQTAFAGPSCCASKTAAKAADVVETAKTDVATKVEATQVNATAKAKKAGASCDLATAKACEASAKKTGHVNADGKVELLSAETMLAKLAKCGIDARSANVEVLSSSLVERACGKYNQAQWTEMIKSAQALEEDKAEVVMANATSLADCCKEDACPMTLVAKDLAKHEAESKNN